MLTPEKQNLDVLRTFGGRKYGRLDAIQNAATRPLLQCDVHLGRIAGTPLIG